MKKPILTNVYFVRHGKKQAKLVAKEFSKIKGELDKINCINSQTIK